MTTDLKWGLLTLLEGMGICLLLYWTSPLLIKLVNNEELLSHPHMMHWASLGIIFIYFGYFVKRWCNFSLEISLKNSTFSLIVEAIGRLFLIIFGAFFGAVYLQSWVANWKECFSLVFMPLLLFAIFLIFKEFEDVAKMLKP